MAAQETLAEDPFGNNSLQGRSPTSHERSARAAWDASYRDGPAPWDIGHPQPAIAALASKGAFTGYVLDAGCGTGEHSLLAATLGLPVLGVDVAETALAMARQKAQDRGLDAEFAIADALRLELMGRLFDTVVDCGLFHTFDAVERLRYSVSLASVTKPGGSLYVLCFSDENPGTVPHPIRQEDLREAFSAERGWSIACIASDRVHTCFHGDAGAPAWLATVSRIRD